MRLTVLPWLLWALLVVAVVGVLAFPRFGLAASYSLLTTSGDSVRLLEQPCEQASAWLKMKKAELRYNGKEYDACWVVIGSVVVVFDSSGDVTPIPVSAFKRESGV